MGDLFGLVIVRPFGIILMMIYEIVQSYGIAIILFALLAKILMLPLSYKSKKSMLKMSRLNGIQAELQKKYGNNKVKFNEELQKVYQQEGVSPMGGCLPTFITLPIMMGLYYAVQKPLTFMIGLDDTSISMLAAKVGVNMEEAVNTVTYQIDIAEKLNSFVAELGVFPEEILNLSTEIRDYLVPIDFSFFGLNLSQSPEFTNPSILWIIPILSGLTAFLSSFVMQKMQAANNGQQQQVQGQMKTLLYVMPLMSVYFGFIFPASIGIYWATNNVLTMVQEVFLTKFLKARRPELYEPPESTQGKKKKNKKGEANL